MNLSPNSFVLYLVLFNYCYKIVWKTYLNIEKMLTTAYTYIKMCWCWVLKKIPFNIQEKVILKWTKYVSNTIQGVECRWKRVWKVCVRIKVNIALKNWIFVFQDSIPTVIISFIWSLPWITSNILYYQFYNRSTFAICNCWYK